MGYHRAWFESNFLYIQLQLCDANLAMQQAKGELFDEPKCLRFLRQMAKALAFLHKQGIVHLDLKPENIYTMGGKYKLGDFGQAAKVDGTLPVVDGDARYMPLEMIRDDHSDLTKVDVFSLGASAYELARGCPLPSQGERFQELRQGKLGLLPTFSAAIHGLLKALMHPQPARRPSAEEILKNPIFI